MGELISGLLRVECLACGAKKSEPHISPAGIFDMEDVAFQHENWCGFLKVLKTSVATTRGWVAIHGYPMRIWLDDVPVKIVHPSGDDWKVS